MHQGAGPGTELASGVGCRAAKAVWMSQFQIFQLLATLVKWIEENGYQTTGAPYELYVKTGYENPNPATWETDIYFPVEKKQG